MIADRTREDADFPNLYPSTLMTSLPWDLKIVFDGVMALDDNVRLGNFSLMGRNNERIAFPYHKTALVIKRHIDLHQDKIRFNW